MGQDMGGRNFHNFVIDINTAVSNAASELVLKGVGRYSAIAALPVSAWSAADIIFEAQFGKENVWRRLANGAGVLAITTPTADEPTIAPEELAKFFLLPITRLRIRSVQTGTITDQNQAAERTVRVYFGG